MLRVVLRVVLRLVVLMRVVHVLEVRRVQR